MSTASQEGYVSIEPRPRETLMSFLRGHARRWLSAGRRVIQRELDADDALLRRALPSIVFLSVVSTALMAFHRMGL